MAGNQLRGLLGDVVSDLSNAATPLVGGLLGGAAGGNKNAGAAGAAASTPAAADGANQQATVAAPATTPPAVVTIPVPVPSLPGVAQNPESVERSSSSAKAEAPSPSPSPSTPQQQQPAPTPAPSSSSGSFASTFTSFATSPPTIVFTVVDPGSTAPSLAPPPTTAAPPALQTSAAAAQPSGGGGGGGMPAPGIMAAAIAGPVAAVALISVGIMMWRRKVRARRRQSVPYDEEFESLKQKHEAKFGLGHNY